jgi:flagellar biosynthesis protein FlhG
MTAAPALVPTAHPKILAVASGKGGVGKTWFSVTMCQTLAQQGKRVLLFDGDLGLANVDVQLGLSAKHDLQNVVEGRISLARAITRYEAGGFDIIAGRSGMGSLGAIPPQALKMVCDGLLELAKSYDHLVIDLGAGVDRTVRQLANLAATTLVVTTDEPTAITDAYAFIKLGRQANPGAAFRLVINLAQTTNEGARTAEALQQACKKFLGFTPGLAGIIRRDNKVREAIRAQTPILTRSPTSDAVADVALIVRRLNDPI